MTFSVISKSCDKLLIGKTYWKSVVQLRVLSAAAVVVWMKDGRKQLQRVENRRQRMEADSWNTNLHTGGSIAGR